MIDLHCHILPEMDDGPATLAEALEMARIAAGDGIRRIVATPHVKEKRPEPEEILQRVDDFNRMLKEKRIPLEVFPGADVSGLLDPCIQQNYTVNGSDYVLFEFPHSHLPANAGDLLFNAMVRGVRPIITHPERNPSIIRKPERLFELVRRGALVQVTAESLTGGFGPDARSCAIFLLGNGAVHFLATDAHSPRHRRPVLSKGVRAAARIVGKASAWRLVHDNPEAVMAGDSVNG